MPPSTAERRSSSIDAKALMAIRNLELRARVVVQGFWNGLHRSPYHGFSVEFTEYREYTPGDDPRYLDWKLYARSDRYYIKKFEDETNLRCHLLVDNSRSMGFGSLGHTKSDYANTLAATLAWFLFQQGDATGLMTFDAEIRDYLPPKARKGHLRQIMLALEKPASGVSTDLAAPLRRIADLVRRRGLLVLVSDLLAPIETLDTHLGFLSAAGHEVVVFQVLDPAELSFQFKEASLFRDLETDQELYIDPEVARTTYQEKFSAHNAAVKQTCERHGIQFHPVVSDQPMEFALFDFMRSRMQRARSVRRRVLR
ncbi:MAG: DUF58 domain-containing protein [Verrucomicrobiales bacterium]|nr:DUF58 domain-containing protein [Verrucomicrobiales bacterium]